MHDVIVMWLSSGVILAHNNKIEDIYALIEQSVMPKCSFLLLFRNIIR